MKDKALIDRLSRATGQIDAIKKMLESESDEDCLLVFQQLKASINALKKFGEAYMLTHMDACLSKGMSKDEMADRLKHVISGSFSL